MFSELSQLLQWLFISHPSSLPAVAQYLVAQLGPAVATGRSCKKPLPSLGALWEGLQATVSPPIPPFLCFSKERLLLLSTEPSSPGFDQVQPPVSSRRRHCKLTPPSRACLCDNELADLFAAAAVSP